MKRATWVGLLGCIGPGAAAATVPAVPLVRTVGGVVVRWEAERIELQPAEPPPEARLGAGELEEATQEAATAWNDALAAAGCRTPLLSVKHGAPTMGAVARNVVTMRTGRWCPPGSDDDLECYPATSGGRTRLRPVGGGSGFAATDDGVIGEVEVEINAVDFSWSLDGERSGTSSLRRLLVHELGHVLGLDHAPPPSAVMYPFPLDPQQAPVLRPDDDAVAALCAHYGRRPGSAWGRLVWPVGVGLGAVSLVAASRRAWRRARARHAARKDGP